LTLLAGFRLHEAITPAIAEEKYVTTPLLCEPAGDPVTIKISSDDPQKVRLIFRHKDERAGLGSRFVQRDRLRRR
jgi:hypothetical protein